MKAALIVVTLIEIALLVVVLAVYLIAIAAKLRGISKTLGLVTFGVRAIDKQTQPIGPVLRDINAALEQVADALEKATGSRPASTEHERIEPIIGPESGASVASDELP